MVMGHYIQSNWARWGGAQEFFPDPFLDLASTFMVETAVSPLRWCEYIFMSNGTYRQAVERVLSYFITDVEVLNVGDDERDRWQNFFEEELKIKSILHAVGLDLLCYGNSFTSVIPTYQRYLDCSNKKCRSRFSFEQVYNNLSFQFDWSDFKFVATCPVCKKRGSWEVTDLKTKSGLGFRIKRWSPHDIELIHDFFSDDTTYVWRIPEEYKRSIREGKFHSLVNADLAVIEAIKNNQLFIFNKDEVYHAKEATLAGLRNRGWGISRTLVNFRQAFYVQSLYRFNESIVLDYIIPFRLITPVQTGGNTDPLYGQNLGLFMSHIHRMIRQRRRDPATWHTLPFPVNYQTLGGDAKTLANPELLNQGLEVLLNAIGVPIDLYKGSLTVQASPVSLRLFEASWSPLIATLNNFLKFITRKIAKHLHWETPTVRLARVTHADDLQRQQTKLQLMMGGQVSQTTGMKSVGLDYREEIRRMMDDQKFQAEQQAKLQEELEEAAFMSQVAKPQPLMPDAQMAAAQPMPPGQDAALASGGAMPTGAVPGGAVPMAGAAGAYQDIIAQFTLPANQPITPEELTSRANILARQILGLPEYEKDSTLIRLKKVNPTMHALVTSIMNDVKQRLKTQGGGMLQAQQFGKPG